MLTKGEVRSLWHNAIVLVKVIITSPRNGQLLDRIARLAVFVRGCLACWTLPLCGCATQEGLMFPLGQPGSTQSGIKPSGGHVFVQFQVWCVQR